MMSFFLNKKVENSCMGTAKVNNIDVILCCVFYIPEPLARGYKIRNEFHKYRMK